MATIKIRRSTTAGAAPTSLVTGELAINEADGALFYRNSGGTVSRLVSPQQSIAYSGQATSALIGRTVLVSNSTHTNIALDSTSSVPAGATIHFVRTGTSTVSFWPGSGGTVYAPETNTLTARYTMAVARKISTTDWVVQVLSTTTTDSYQGFSSTPSLMSTAQFLLDSSNSTPTSGGALTINGVALGNMDYVVKQGNQTVSSFTAGDWFTTTEDTASAWVVVNGNLTINSGITFRPTVRKLFTVVYVEGNLTLNGTISMSLRGANHSGTGNSAGATTAGNIRVATGTYSGITDPTIPAAGGAGGNANVGGGFATLGTGGGGGGGNGAFGAAGTCFTGGAGGGAWPGVPFSNPTAGVANGGAGGGGGGAPGGIGNPPGSPTTGVTNDTGTGGTLVVIVNGTISGSGSMTATGGGQSTSSQAYTGGSSGGGAIIFMRKSGSGPTLSAAGGVSSGASTQNGGSGGTGATSTLTIP